MRKFDALVEQIIKSGTENAINRTVYKIIVVYNSFLVTVWIGWLVIGALFILHTQENKLFIQSTYVLFHLAFLACYLLMRYGYYQLAKISFVACLHLVVFVSDNFFGHEISVTSFYLSFLFITLGIYTSEEDRKKRLWFVLLPFVLLFLTQLFTRNWFPHTTLTHNGEIFLYSFCLFWSLILIVISTYNLTRSNERNENTMEQMRLNLQTLIDNTQGTIWSINKDFKVVAANKTYQAIIKHAFGVHIAPGFDMHELFAVPHYPRGLIEHYKNTLAGKPIFLEFDYDGRDYDVQSSPITNKEGNVIGAAFFSIDITERKKAEAEIVNAKNRAEEASLAKAHFLSNMSHELRTPLNGIIGLTNILLSEPYLNEQQKVLDNLKYSSDHMLSLVDNILDFNKIEAGKLEIEYVTFNLFGMVQKLISFFEGQVRHKKLSFHVNMDEATNVFVLSDITRLRQILTNLLSNAIKFTSKGFIGIDVTCQKQMHKDQLLVRFAIEDSGIGIEKDKIGLIFQSFTQADIKTTRKFGGSGLGLTISKNLAELMGGTLIVESEIGKGSKFIVDIPFTISKEQSTVQSEKRLNDYDALQNVRILVAEDNKVNMMVVKNILQKWNVEVTMVENGQEAIDKLSESNFDLILMDLEMPVMDRPTAVGIIRMTKPNLPIIALTAAFYDNMYEDLLEKGMNDYVKKPFRPEDLYTKIFKHLQRNAIF